VRNQIDVFSRPRKHQMIGLKQISLSWNRHFL
jgi:hypothetical protein